MRQVGYFQELYGDALSTEHKKTSYDLLSHNSQQMLKSPPPKPFHTRTCLVMNCRTFLNVPGRLRMA